EQFAALLVRYFPQIAELPQNPQIVTDTQDSWADPEIQTIVRVGLIDPNPNHTFQPSSIVSRGEFARTLARLSGMLGLRASSGPPIPTVDLAPNTALYPDVQLVLGFGALTLDDAGQFNASGSVSGEQAVHAATRLLQLLKERTG